MRYKRITLPWQVKEVEDPTAGSFGGFGITDKSVSIAFCPVTTIASQAGICPNTASKSIGRMTSKNLSEALAFKRTTSIAVSPKPIPLSLQKAFAFSSLNAWGAFKK